MLICLETHFVKNNKHCFALWVCIFVWLVGFWGFLREIQSMGKSWCQCYEPALIWLAKAGRAGTKPEPGHSRIPAPYFSFHILLLSCWSCQLHRKLSYYEARWSKNSHLVLNPWEWGWIHEEIQHVTEFCYRTHFSGNVFAEELFWLLHFVFNCTLCFSFLIWLQECIP